MDGFAVSLKIADLGVDSETIGCLEITDRKLADIVVDAPARLGDIGYVNGHAYSVVEPDPEHVTGDRTQHPLIGNAPLLGQTPAGTPVDRERVVSFQVIARRGEREELVHG